MGASTSASLVQESFEDDVYLTASSSFSSDSSVQESLEDDAYSRASSVQKSFKYDVFLSFSGKDTRKNFVDHLYKALVDKGIITYKDDEKIQKGERISEQLIRSIQDSRFYIIVFSKNYASSSWCLDELVKIMECQKMPEHTAYPVFYDVEPTEVRKQTKGVGEAFAEQIEKEGAGRWRDALKEAAGLAGWELKNTVGGHEATFIQKIVLHILLKLSFINRRVDEDLVGMETRVENVVSSLEIGSEDVRLIGIWGMGGGGKTTLAAAVFNRISDWFDGTSFVENIREVSKSTLSGLKELQKKVLSDVLNDQSTIVRSVSDGKNMMIKMMGSRKVLVVLDDVDDIGQLEALAGKSNWFKPGSRIIITTRDEQVLVAHRVNFIHHVNLLLDDEATCLFSRYAFGREIPNQGYEELSRKVVHYAGGLPLTIKVLGSHLCGRSELEWVDTIERLKRIPLNETLKRLKISYDSLEDDHKEIFLDIVCILKGEMKDNAIRILESCGLSAKIGLRVLVQKSLISISGTSVLGFHDHIEEMGWNIVRRLHPDEPSKHNRLWIKDEIEDILVKELGTKATRSIKLKNTDLKPGVIMKGLKKMKELRCLYVYNQYKREDDEVSQYLPESLRSLYWLNYSFCCLPKTFQAKKLVNLEMELSNISSLWEEREGKVLDTLRYLVLSGSKLRTFDLEMTPNLERLNLAKCIEFVELHMPAKCTKLKDLNLSGSKVSNLNLMMTPDLEILYLRGCNEFVTLSLPVECPNLKSLDLGGSKLRTFDLGMTPSLERLYLSNCREFVELHMPAKCSKLKDLNLSGSKVSNLDLGKSPYLESLYLRDCKELLDFHLPVECLNLKFLDLSDSKVSNLNLGKTVHLEVLFLHKCKFFVDFHKPIEFPKLRNLVLSHSRLRTFDLRMTPNIERLDFEQCFELKELQIPVKCPNLKFLNLSQSKVSYLNLEMTPLLKELNLYRCLHLEKIHAPVGCLKNLAYLNLHYCLRFRYFLVEKSKDSVTTFKLDVVSVDKCQLHPNSNLPKLVLGGRYVDTLPSSSGNIERLFSFGLCACTNLESFSSSMSGLQNLKELTLEDGVPEALLNDLYQLESLENLILKMKEIKQLPDGIFMLKNLKSLELNSCKHLEQIPENIFRLECLEKLILTDCKFLDIPNTICNMKCLKHLDLSKCTQIGKLPAELGRLECLEELRLKGCRSLRDIPKSIFNMKCLKHLDLSDCTLIERLPEELGRLECLESLHMRYCRSLRYIPNNICSNMKCLKSLDLSGCIPIERLLEELGCLECLESLHLRNCSSLRDLPKSICNMKCLKNLDLSYCTLIKTLPEELVHLERLKELDITSAGISHLPESIYQLKGLEIIGDREQLESYGFTSLKNTSKLSLSYCVKL